MKIDTEEFRATHGRRPTGFGLWIFAIGRNGSWTLFEHTGKLAEAKKAATRFARENGCDRIALQP